jgi:hypothetical protein
MPDAQFAAGANRSGLHAPSTVQVQLAPPAGVGQEYVPVLRLTEVPEQEAPAPEGAVALQLPVGDVEGPEQAAHPALVAAKLLSHAPPPRPPTLEAPPLLPLQLKNSLNTRLFGPD